MNDDGYDKQELDTETDYGELFSKAVKAGRRTYFFDVRTTKKNEYFLTITESKKRFHKDGQFYFEKHKIYLYKEDFKKFTEGIAEVLKFIKRNKAEGYLINGNKNFFNTVNNNTLVSVEYDDLEEVEYNRDHSGMD